LASYNGFKSLKPFISKLPMCDLDRFSKIQSHLLIAENVQILQKLDFHCYKL